MSKAIMASIQPEWSMLIANRVKTLEIRKTKPKIETPFKVYVYCTKETKKSVFKLYITELNFREKYGTTTRWRSGKSVVDVNSHLPHARHSDYRADGKVIGEFMCDYILSHCERTNADIAERQSCVKREKLYEYATGKQLYGWHISDLVIYDKPKELSEFGLERAPQSWCYVEGLKGAENADNV